MHSLRSSIRRVRAAPIRSARRRVASTHAQSRELADNLFFVVAIVKYGDPILILSCDLRLRRSTSTCTCRLSQRLYTSKKFSPSASGSVLYNQYNTSDLFDLSSYFWTTFRPTSFLCHFFSLLAFRNISMLHSCTE